MQKMSMRMGFSLISMCNPLPIPVPLERTKLATSMSSSANHSSALAQTAQSKSTVNARSAREFSHVFDLLQAWVLSTRSHCLIVNEATTLRRHCEAKFAVHFYTSNYRHLNLICICRGDIGNGWRPMALHPNCQVMLPPKKRKPHKPNKPLMCIWQSVSSLSVSSHTPINFFEKRQSNGSSWQTR